MHVLPSTDSITSSRSWPSCAQGSKREREDKEEVERERESVCVCVWCLANPKRTTVLQEAARTATIKSRISASGSGCRPAGPGSAGMGPSPAVHSSSSGCRSAQGQVRGTSTHTSTHRHTSTQPHKHTATQEHKYTRTSTPKDTYTTRTQQKGRHKQGT